VQKKYVEVPQPHVVAQYNKFMFGVDRFDQNNNHLRIAMGGKKWYWPVVTWLLNTSVHNAWHLHKRSGGTMKLLSFKRELVCAIPRSAAATREGFRLVPWAPDPVGMTSAMTKPPTSSRGVTCAGCVPWRTAP
jgi:hypothetical protein